jgi:tRNA modification GTPase
MMDRTIVAISTPVGEGGIAVIRISGPEAFTVTARFFEGKGDLMSLESHRALHGWIKDGQEAIDEVIVTLFRSPNSYTGEDMIEVSCHGGTFISRRIVDLFVREGARPASPGEFTQRAFLNGKMDLSQAEAVADLIRAKTEVSRKVAVYQLEGHLSEKLESIREQLVHACSMVELELDFGEEDVEFASRKDMKVQLESIRLEFQVLLASFKMGRICREGIRMVIAGKPNVGKSSLLNILLARERAIVTHTPGTTRDTIEDVLDMGGLLFIVTDTAGIRITDDPVESEGVRRAEQAMKRADLVLLVFDSSEEFSPEDEMMIQHAREMQCQKIAVVNKNDLDRKIDMVKLRDGLQDIGIVQISAKTQEGFPVLIDSIERTVLSGKIPREGEIVLTQARHHDCIARAYERLSLCLASIEDGMSQEFIALDLRGAMEAIGEITGKTATDDVLERIFSEFCIGK